MNVPKLTLNFAAPMSLLLQFMELELELEQLLELLVELLLTLHLGEGV